MTKTTLELLIDVRDARIKAAEDKIAKEIKMAQPDIVAAVSAHVASRNVEAEAIKALKDHVLKTKEIHDKASIKKRKGFKYSQTAAFVWCREMLAAAIIFDTKVFENYLKTAKELPDFVAKTETPYVTIASDLSGLQETAQIQDE